MTETRRSRASHWRARLSEGRKNNKVGLAVGLTAMLTALTMLLAFLLLLAAG